MNITKDTITYTSDDFIGGFVPVQNAVARSLGEGVGSMFNMNPFRVPGLAGPGGLATDATDVTATLPSATQVDVIADNGGQYAYSLGGTGTDARLNKYDITSNSIIDDADWPYTIPPHGGHATANANLGSVVIYNVSGTERVFFSWGDDTDWDVGTLLPSATFNPSFMSTTATTPLAAPYLAAGQGKPHPLYVARADDIMYIGSGNYVHSYKGSTSTFNAAVLTLPVGYVVTGFAETPFDLVIFATTAYNSTRRGKSTVFFWDNGRPVTYYKQIPLIDDTVQGAFSFGSVIGCFTRSRNESQSVLRVLEGDEFRPKFYWSGSLPTVGGVDILNNQIVWNSDGKIYRWGSFNGQFPEGTFQTESGSGSTSGFCRSLRSGILYASSGTGTSGGFQYFTAYSSSATIDTKTAFPEFPANTQGQIRSVEISLGYTGGTSASSRSFALYYVPETNSAIEIIPTTSNVLATPIKGAIAIDALSFPDRSRLNFSSLRLYLEWSSGTGSAAAPLIKWIKVYYDLIPFVSEVP